MDSLTAKTESPTLPSFRSLKRVHSSAAPSSLLSQQGAISHAVLAGTAGRGLLSTAHAIFHAYLICLITLARGQRRGST